jgi:hypothetical protein
MNAVWGVRGLIVPLLATWPLGLGIADVRTMLLLCSAATGLGALLFLGLGETERIEADGTQATVDGSIVTAEVAVEARA